jgi:hypothetical protein
LILLRKGREIDIGIGEIDSLLGRDLAIVSGTGTNGLRIDDFEDVKGENTIVNVDDTSWLNDLGNVLVVNVPRTLVLALKKNSRAQKFTYMFLASQDLAYFSSVVMLISDPAEIGMSSSLVVFPVLISGPLVSRAMAI